MRKQAIYCDLWETEKKKEKVTVSGSMGLMNRDARCGGHGLLKIYLNFFFLAELSKFKRI